VTTPAALLAHRIGCARTSEGTTAAGGDGKETANIHVGTERKAAGDPERPARDEKGNWLLGAAQAMADAMEKIGECGRERGGLAELDSASALLE